MADLPKSTENISVSLKSWLLEYLDLYCEQNDCNRSQIVSRAVKKFLWDQRESLERWEEEYQKLHDESC